MACSSIERDCRLDRQDGHRTETGTVPPAQLQREANLNRGACFGKIGHRNLEDNAHQKLAVAVLCFDAKIDCDQSPSSLPSGTGHCGD